ncbi:hypothetical protein PC129_g20783 [Phytophthora cactorum]|uniref:Uncharacterized protein n=1 Tax=Phytophthora cactorum TaxID=29920 RepID=A0A8T1H7M2_9STRA|nr:hypothetical protein PC129_g20783 [Phytophthora cactorum]
MMSQLNNKRRSCFGSFEVQLVDTRGRTRLVDLESAIRADWSSDCHVELAIDDLPGGRDHGVPEVVEQEDGLVSVSVLQERIE